MQKKSLYTVKCTLNVHPVFSIYAKDFPQAAKKADKLVKELDPQAQITEVLLEKLILLEDLPQEDTPQ